MLSYQIKKVKLKNLQSFVNSYLFINSDVIPISKNRVVSYLNNPRANEEDYVLYIAIYNDKIIAFRTLLSDKIFYKSYKYKFAWFSGSWVHPKYRRIGISTKLMNEAFKDWEQKLMYTNFAPSSKLLYDKSGKFVLLKVKKGIRLYFNIRLTDLLIPKFNSLKQIIHIIKFIDYVLSFFLYPLRYIINKNNIRHLNNAEITNSFTDSHYDFIKKHNQSLFRREKKEYDWIFEFPWITTVKEETKPYPFSVCDKIFYYKVFTVYDRGNIIALALVKVRNRKIDIPVYVSEINKGSYLLARSILAYAHKIRADILTCYTHDFVRIIKEKKGIALYRKAIFQRYYASKQIINILGGYEGSFDAFDGDGDNIFT